MRRWLWLALLGLLGGAAAVVAGPAQTSADGIDPFVAKIEVGTPGAGGTSCTGSLVHRQWLVTARTCFEAGGQTVTLGPPKRATMATVGRADLSTTSGHVVPVVRLVPHPQRDVVLARLATPISGIAPVPIGSAAPSVGERLRLIGYGRTRTEWVPNRAHTATFEVTSVGTSTMDITGVTADQAGPCKGDAGGPALRDGGGGTELVAIGHSSWQGGCVGETETRRGALETRVDDIRDWIRLATTDVSVFGVLADGRLTYSGIDSATGDRLGTVTSAAALPFAAGSMATLNFNTLLVASTTGVLYRVDITATNPLRFDPPVQIGTGYTHKLLAYDGDGSLFGIAAATGALRRYTVPSAKPSTLINNTLIGDRGFGTLKTLATAGPDLLLATTSAGVLIQYRISDNTWSRTDLATSGWDYEHLLSPGDGLYYARAAQGAMLRFRDQNPLNGSGTDIQSFPSDPVDTSGWNQTLLSAVPLTSFPESPVDVSIFGIRSDGRLTYSQIDSATGDRLGTVTSAAALPFAAGSMATLNFNTLLVASTTGVLYRVDITATNPLRFDPPVQIGTGYTHKLLAYDGDGSLFGIAAATGALRRYTVPSAKPSTLTNNTLIGASGFGSLRTLAAAAPDLLLATTSAGTLIQYRITDTWARTDLASSGWNHAHLLSPGNGLYYARTAQGAMLRFRDQNPLNGSGTDIQSFPNDPVDTGGWDQALLSAQPFSA
ncbi:trypsin-like serine protease [Micromonospora deserti]|uniref:trypsin-like serine protease n=1 Tax=Micromonospora deserti TaxID=2070366 RepID=UPI001F35E515|nr:trypsin-like serine protease [Micromonospora deserti]